MKRSITALWRTALVLGALSFWMASSGRAAQRTFDLNGVTLALEDVTSEVDVYYRSMRLNRALNQWNVEVILSNKASRVLSGPVVLLVESFAGTSGPLQPDGLNANQPFYEMSSQLGDGAFAPAERSAPRTLALGFRANGSPALITRVFVRPLTLLEGFSFTRSLNEVGQPLPGVAIEESGPAGTRIHQTDGVFAVATLGQGTGLNRWIFSAPNHLPVWRQLSLAAAEIGVLPNPRLTARETQVVTFTPIAGGLVSNRTDTIQITFGPGAFPTDTPGTLTALTGQTLPAFLPQGWSPLQAFWLELANEPAFPGTLRVEPWGPLNPGETAAFVHWNPTAFRWDVLQLVDGHEGNPILAPITNSGAFALVVGDLGAVAPPAARAGEPLPASVVPAPDVARLAASGRVDPTSSPASKIPERVTATAEIVFTNATDDLPSGLLFRCEVTETYNLRDGSRRVSPQYENFIVGYQRPGDANLRTLQAAFPMRPLLLFGAEELAEATVKVEVLSPLTFAGTLFDTNGGQLVAGNLRVLAAPGDVPSPQAAHLRLLDPTNFTALVPAGLTLVTAFDLTIGAVAPDHKLTLQRSGTPTNRLFVLARVVSDRGVYGLEPVERLSTGVSDRLFSTEPANGERLAGLTGAGQYVLLQVNAAQALVSGIAKDARGQPANGLVVRLAHWLTFSGADGRYRLLAPTGTNEISATDLASGDTGENTIIVSSTQNISVPDFSTGSSAPRVLTVIPSANSTGISRISPILVTFSEPLNPGTLVPGGLRLLQTNGQPIAAGVTLNLKNTIATLLPTEQLPPRARLTVSLAPTVADVTGLPLEGPREFSFTTESDLLRRAEAELLIFEPANNDAPMSGGAGLAEPDSPVILVNETTGFTSTVLSKPDGSFSNSIPAGVDDELAIVLVNRNGTRNRVTPAKQIFADGSVGLFAGGGEVATAGEGGSYSVTLPPGSVSGKTILKLTPVPLEVATNDLPVPALNQRIAAAVDLQMRGDKASGFAGFSVPFDLEQFGVPEGLSPTNMTFTLAVARVVDGEPAYQVVDEMEFRDGRLSALGREPFPGWLEGLDQDTNPLLKPPRAQPVRLARNAPHEAAISPQFFLTFIAADIARMVVLAALDPPLRLTGKVGLCIAQTETGCIEEHLDALFGVGNAAIGLASTLDIVLDAAAAGLTAIANQSRIPLPGAVVDAAIVVTNQRPQFTRGMPYGVSDRGGRYSLLLPGARDVYLARARHPSYQDAQFRPVAPVLEALFVAPFVRRNFTFTAETGALLPPKLTVSQTPLFPKTNEATTLFFDVVHRNAVSATGSAVLLAVKPLPGDTNTPLPTVSDIIKTEPIPVPGFGGIGQKRFAFTNTAARPLLAEFRISATVFVGTRPRSTTNLWTVAFGGEPSASNLPIQSDELDKAGPSLVRVAPISGGTLAPGEPIRLIFNEPIHASITNSTALFTLVPQVPGGLVTRLTADQTVLEILPPALQPGTSYTLTFQTPVRDLANNPLQSGAFAGLNVTVRFTTPATVSAPLPNIGQGGGAVAHENFIYTLDRAGNGRLVVFDASIPTQPLQIAAVDLPGFPRDLEFVPNWSYYLRPPDFSPGETPRTNRNLLLIVGGLVGTRDAPAFNPDFQRQYLRVYDVTDPANPTRIASTELSQRPSAVQKITWEPPEAAFFENGADFQQVAVLDLQAFINAYNLSLSERVAFGADAFTPGFDGSGLRPDGTTNATPNGHYTDAGDRLPRWQKEPADFFGRILSFSLSPADGTRRVLDYAYDRNFNVGALVFSGGFETTTEGNPTAQRLFPGFRVAHLLGDPVFAPSATFAFGGGANPKRVHLEFQVNVGTATDPDLRNLAFVSLAPDADGKPKLTVLDISDPIAPTELRRMTLPGELGLPQSIYRLPDGQLALALTTDALVFDPTLAAHPNPDSEFALHPMFRNRLPGAGSGNQTLSVSRAGLFAVSLGGRSQVVQLQPKLRIVQFRPNEALATNSLTAPMAGADVPLPPAIKSNPARAAAFMRSIVEVFTVQPASVSGLSSNTPGLLPPSRPGHYYLLLEAPGGAGAEVLLGLQSLSRAGHPLRNKGRDFPAVRAVSAAASAAIQQTARAGCDAPGRELRAFRLSDDPKSELYDRYLSEPFAVVVEKTTLAKLTQIQAALPRAVLWSAHHLSAFIDPEMDDNPVLGPFAARISGFAGDGADLAIVPRTEATAETFAGTYIPGPNPPPANGHESMPGTFGMVSAHNAEIRHDTLDIALPGRALPIVFQRSIGGQDLYEGPFGRGWDFAYNQQVVPLRPQTFGSRSELMFVVATLTNAAGGVTPFARSGDLVFADGAGHLIPYVSAGGEPPPEVNTDPLVDQLHWRERTRAYYLPSTNAPGVFDPIFEFHDGSFARLTPAGEQFWYDRLGRLTKVYDRHTANFHELLYNERSELIRIIDRTITDGSRVLEIGYYRLTADQFFVSDLDLVTPNAFIAGKIARLRDYTGRAVDFEYDADALLLRRKGIAGSGVNGGSAARPETTYLWSGCDGALGGLTAGGAPSAQDSGLFAAAVDSATRRVNGAGNGVGGTVQMEFSGGATSDSKITGPDNAITEFKFDRRGYPTERRESGPLNGVALTQFGYNQQGQLTNQVLPLGDSLGFTYDSTNRVLRARSNLLRLERKPGPRGGPTLVWSAPGYDLRFNLPQDETTDFNGHRHLYTLTADGKEIEKIVHVGAGETRYRYNEFGQIEDTTTPDGISMGYEYAELSGFPLVEKRGNNRFEFGYDSSLSSRLARPATIRPPRGAEIQVTYDDRLLPTEIRRGQMVIKRGYDANGNATYRERKVGATARLIERRVFNRINFLEELSVEAVDVDGSPVTLTTKFASSPADAWRVRTVTYPGGQVRKFDYDHLGLARKITLGNYVEEFVRDLNGNVLEFRQGGQLTGKFSYDGHDRVTNSVAVGAQGEESTTRSYFPAGELASLVVSDPRFGESYRLVVEEIDALGRVKRQRQKGSVTDAVTTFEYPADGTGGAVITDGPRDRVETRHDRAGYPRSFQHALATMTLTPDGNGNITGSISTENGRAYLASSGYDDLDHLLDSGDDLGIHTRFEPRADGSPEKIFDGRNKKTDQEFSVLGELLQQIRPNNVQFNFRHDKNRQSTLAGDTALKGHEHVYDAATFRPTEFRLRSGASYLFDSPNELNLPRQVTTPGGSMSVTYDLQGRVTGRNATYPQGEPYEMTFQQDALGRPRSSTYGRSGQNSATFKYDLLGPLTEASFTESHGTFTVTTTLNSDSSRATVHYPSGLTLFEDRDAGARLNAVREGAGDLYRVPVNGYVGVGERGEVALGNGLIKEVNRFDLRRRLAARAFIRNSDGVLLAEIRYRYDDADNIIARQELHRHGRTDRYDYDDGNRLVRADIGLRVELTGAVRHNAAGLNEDFGLKAGRYARQYNYDGQGFDLLERITTINPNPLTVAPIPFAAALADPDGMLFPIKLDGVDRGAPDPLGNTISTRLLVTGASGSLQRVPAQLKYSAFSQLMRVERTDGVVIEYEHQPSGLIHRRKLTAPGITTDLAFIWDEGRLIEEYERVGGTNRLRARYLYADEDSPFAADLADAAGNLARHWYLRDALSSVVAVADTNGVVVERIQYDPWGQPRIEGRDIRPPQVAFVAAAVNGQFILQFSEPIFPPLNAPAAAALPGREGTLFTSSRQLPADVVKVVTTGGLVLADLVYEDDLPSGFAFGQIIRVKPQTTSAQVLGLEIAGGFLVDEWGNSNIVETLNFIIPTGSQPLYEAPAAQQDTRPPVLSRSAVGSPFLFHGQFFDAEAGLLYLRARFYDPSTGMFLQQDPSAYIDSPNLLAGFANNPTSARDPEGTNLPLPTKGVKAATKVSGKVGGRARGIADAASPSVGVPRTRRADASLDSAEDVFGHSPPPPPMRGLSAAQLEAARVRGRAEIDSLTEFKEGAMKSGKLRVEYADLEPVHVEGGLFTKGSMGNHKFDPATGVSTVTINSRAQAAALNTPMGSTLRKQLQLTELHELSHAQNALGAGKRASYGRESFLEELGVHASEADIEIALFGRNSSVMTANRRMYQSGGLEGIANQMMMSPGYQKQFKIGNRPQAIALLRSYGYHLHANPTFGPRAKPLD